MPQTKIEQDLIRLLRAAWFDADGTGRLPDFGRIDWPRFMQAAIQHGLAPLVFASFRKLARTAELPVKVLETWRLAYVRSAISNQLAFRELDHWIDHCRREAIPLIVLKGGALAHTLYPDPALRPMGDLDLLIPRSALARMEQALAAAGFAASIDVADGFAERYQVERGFTRLGTRPAQIDLHWHAFTMPYYSERIPIEWFWQRTDQFLANDREALTLAPTAQLLYLSAHSLMHHYRRLIWSFDLALLLDRFAEKIDWDETIAAASEFGLTPVLRQTLSEVSELWGLTLPAGAERLLAQPTPWKDRAMLAIGSSPSPLPSELSLRGVRNKFAYAVGRIFPAPDYMRKRYRFHGRGLLPFTYLWRAGTGTYQLARASLSIILTSIRVRPRRRAA